MKTGSATSNMLERTLNLSLLALNLLLLTLISPSALRPAESHVTLSIGVKAPDFCLPGIDDKTHCLKDYDSSKVLVIVFTCNHCPTAQLYENRLKQLDEPKQSGSVTPGYLNAVPTPSERWADGRASFAGGGTTLGLPARGYRFRLGSLRSVCASPAKCGARRSPFHS